MLLFKGLQELALSLAWNQVGALQYCSKGKICALFFFFLQGVLETVGIVGSQFYWLFSVNLPLSISCSQTPLLEINICFDLKFNFIWVDCSHLHKIFRALCVIERYMKICGV